MTKNTQLITLTGGELTHNPEDPCPTTAYLATLSESGARTQHTALNNLAYMFSDGKIEDATKFPWHNLRYEHSNSLPAHMLEIGYAKASVNKHLVALRRVLAEAYRLQLFVDHNDYYRAVSVRSLRHESIPRGRKLEQSELGALVQACLAQTKNPALATRDATIISVLYATGMRRQELVTLNLADFDAREGKLRLTGKGSKQREVFISEDVVSAIEAWLVHRGRQLGPLFTRISKSGKVSLKRLSAQAIYLILQNRQKQAGIAPFSPHDIRRTTITDMLSADVDVLTVSAIAGHASADTTRRYDKRGDESKREAARKIQSPFKGH